jgi:hypothetical protein
MKALTHFSRWWLLLLLVGCQDVIDLDLPEGETLPVISGLISTTQPAQVTVKLSASFLEPTPLPTISGARVILFENDQPADSLVEDTTAGTYRGTLIGQIGSQYRIEVTFPADAPKYAGTTWVSFAETIVPAPPIDSIYSAFLTGVPFQEDGWFPFYMFNDPPGEANQYRLVKWRRDSIKNLPTDLTVFRDEFFDGIRFDDVQAPAIQPESDPLDSGDRYAIEQSSLSRPFYDYLDAVREQTVNVGSTVDPPPRRIIGNIRLKGDNNTFALGFFGATDVARADWIIGVN